MIIDRLSGDGIGDHELVGIIVLWELETALVHLPLRPHPVSICLFYVGNTLPLVP